MMLIPMLTSDAADISANPEFRYRTYKDRIGYTTFKIHNSTEISSQPTGLATDRYIGFKDADDERLLFYDQFGGGEVVYVTSNFRPPSPWAKLLLIDYQGSPIGSETYPVLFIPKNCFMQGNWKTAKYPMMGRQNGPYECQILTSPITMLGLFWIHSRSVSSNESFQVVWLYSTLLSIPIAKLSMSAENTGEVVITTTLISKFSEYPFIGELHVIEKNR